VEAALAARAERIERGGVALHRETDAEGSVSGEPVLLERAFGHLIDAALDDLELAGDPSPRLDVELGESLAGSEVWLRVRAEAQGRVTGRSGGSSAPRRPSLDTAREIVEAHGGVFEANDAPGAGFEVVLTFPKRDDAPRPRLAHLDLTN
jgi:signal transduction histidine kinase